MAALKGAAMLLCLLFCVLIKSSIAPSATEQPFVITTAKSTCSLDGDVQCKDVPQSCANCTFNSSCIYGDQTTISCTTFESVKCWVLLANISNSL